MLGSGKNQSQGLWRYILNKQFLRQQFVYYYSKKWSNLLSSAEEIIRPGTDLENVKSEKQNIITKVCI